MEDKQPPEDLNEVNGEASETSEQPTIKANKKWLAVGGITLAVVLVLGVVWLALGNDGEQSIPAVTNQEPIITNYQECVAAGYPVMESYPEQCAVPGGETYTSMLSFSNKLNYENDELGFNFMYPETWVIEEDRGTFTKLDEPTVEIALTTELDRMLSVTAHYGGKGGGPCIPDSNDDFHSLNAQCATTEVLSVEELDMYVESEEVYEDTGRSYLHILERKLTIPDKFESENRTPGTVYQVCMAFADPDRQFEVGTSFGWGVSPVPSPIFRDTKPDFFYLESCISGDSAEFLTSNDAELAKELYRSLVVTQ